MAFQLGGNAAAVSSHASGKTVSGPAGAPSAFAGGRPAQPQRNAVAAPAVTAAATADTAAARGPAALAERDIDLLASLAAMQIRYGRPEEAIAYLMGLRRMRPGNGKILRLTALALMKLGRWDEAEILLGELEEAQGGSSRVSALWRALILLKRNRFADARQWFWRTAGAGRASE